MKKRIILVVVIVILLILLFPIPFRLKDGGSIQFRALLYTITKYYQLAPIDADMNNGYIEGIGIKILGMEIYNNTKERVIECNDDEQSQTSTNQQVHNSFVGTILEETTTYMIVEPNEDEVEKKSADKIVINYGTDHIDYLYGVGRKVIINYTGDIMESYPAQINTDNILINGYEKFELTVKTSDNKNTNKILNNRDLYKNNSDYDLYYYGLDEVKITVDNKTMSLKEALRSGKMTIDGLIIKANKDFPNAVSYDDGGSMEYHYDNYTIIKLHKVDGNRNVYIGTKNMTINDIL